MKNRKIVITCVIICGIIALCLFKLKGEEAETGLFQGHANLVMKQGESGIEYYVAMDPYTIYNYLTGMKLERAESVLFDYWRYKIVLTNTMTSNEDGRRMIHYNEDQSVIEVYGDYLVIDGTPYLFPDGEDVLGWFDRLYDYNADQYELYTLYEPE